MALTKVIGAGAEGLTLSSTSLTVANGLTLTDGDIALASGHGISFAADSSASGMASELFDDYEEGTWTPNVTGGTGYDFQYGYYVKVGKMVFASFDIDMSSISSNTNRLHGLPFASATSTLPPFGVAHIGYYSDIVTGVHWLSGYVQAGNASIYFTGNSSSTTTIQHNTFNVFGGSTRLLGCITYLV